MEIISEKKIFDISKKLGETEGVFDLRKKAFSILNSNKNINLRHGLGINVDVSEFFSKKKVNLPEYKIKNNGEVEILNWEDVFKNEIYKKEIQEGLKNSYLSMIKNIVSTNSLASFSGGKVIVSSENQEAEVFLDTDCFGSYDIVFVIAQENSQLAIFDSIKSSNFSGGRNIIVIAKKGSVVKYIQTQKGVKALYNNVIYFAEKGAQVFYTDTSLSNNSLLKTDINQYLDGECSRGEIQNISVSSKSGVVDIEAVIHHRASHTTSKIFANGVAADKSRTIYRSDICMKEDNSDFIVGDQKANFLILSSKAEVDAIPSLDISQKEVQCSHSVSVSHIKESDLYYPKLRGIKKDDASRMIVSGVLLSGLQDMQKTNTVNLLQENLNKINF